MWEPHWFLWLQYLIARSASSTAVSLSLATSDFFQELFFGGERKYMWTEEKIATWMMTILPQAASYTMQMIQIESKPLSFGGPTLCEVVKQLEGSFRSCVDYCRQKSWSVLVTSKYELVVIGKPMRIQEYFIFDSYRLSRWRRIKYLLEYEPFFSVLSAREYKHCSIFTHDRGCRFTKESLHAEL